MSQSAGSPPTFTRASDGRLLELRRGCVVECDSRCVLTSSEESTGYLLRNCLLSAEQVLHWAEFGPAICASAAQAMGIGFGASKG